MKFYVQNRNKTNEVLCRLLGGMETTSHGEVREEKGEKGETTYSSGDSPFRRKYYKVMEFYAPITCIYERMKQGQKKRAYM